MTNTTIDYKQAYEQLQQTYETKATKFTEIMALHAKQMHLLKELKALKGFSLTTVASDFVAEQIRVIAKNALYAIAIQYENLLLEKQQLYLSQCDEMWVMTRNLIFIADEGVEERLDALRVRLLELKESLLKKKQKDFNESYRCMGFVQETLEALVDTMDFQPDFKEASGFFVNETNHLCYIADLQIAEMYLYNGIHEVQIYG